MRTPEFKEWFGDWESLRAQKRLDEMEPVVVPIPDEWRGLSLEQWRSKMVDSLGSLMADERKGRLATAIVHPELGEIFVNRDGINKTKSASADPAKILVAANLKDVLPQAVYAHSRPLNKPKRDILIEGYATLYAKVEVGGVPLIAVFTVERKTDGKWYYNTVMRLASENEKTRKFQIGGLTGGPVQGAPLAGLAEGKRDVLHRVNPESVSKTVDPDTGEPSAEGLAESGEYTAGGIGSTGRPEGSSGRLAGTGVQGKAPVGSAGSQPGVLHSPLRLGQPNAARTELAGPASSAGQRPVSAPQVMGAIARVAEALGRDGRSVNRVGRVGNKRALGSYLLDAQVARIRSANDVSTAAHELAHAMDDALWGEPEHWKRNALGLQEQARAELERLGRDLYTEGEPHNGYHSEGFAEFVRLWLTDGPQAKEKAPTFAKWWQAEVLGKSPKLARAVEQAQELGTRWFTQGALLRAHSGIVEQPTRTQELVTTARREVSQLRKRWIEAAAAVEDLVEEAARLRGDPGGKLPVALDPMETLRAGRRKAEAKVDYFAQVGLTDFGDNRTGVAPLADAFKLMPKRRVRDFLIYLWAKRALALWDDPRGPRNGGLDRADAAYLVAELGSPQFERAAAIVYAWTEGVLDYVAQASPALAETVRRIREVDPGSYIPLRREFAEFERQYRSGGGGGNTAASRAELTKRLRGSTRRIKNPVHSMLVQTKELVLKAHQRRVIDQILHLTRTVKGLGHYAVEVPAERVPAAQRPLSGLLERIEAQEAAQQGRVQELSAQDREDLAHREFLDGEPVARLTGEEFSQGEGGMLRDRIAQWYAEHDRATVEVGGVGTVQLDRRAVERSLSHGHNRAKIAAFAAVPDVLRRGRLVHEEPLRGSTQSGRFLHLAAPVEVGGRGHILDVVVKADTSGGRLYLHNVVLREKLQHPPTQGTGGPGSAVAASEAGKRSASTDAGVIETVLQRIYSVKADNLEAGAREGVEGLTSPSRSQVTNEDARSRGPSRELLVQGWQPVKEQGMAAGEAEGTDSSSLLEEMVNFFGPAAEEPKAGEWPRLPVWEDGRLRWYELEPELYAALAAMDAAQVSPVVEWLGGKWARAFRLGTTGLNAGFSLITNTTRDLTTLMLNSTANGSRGDGRGTILHHGIVAQKRHKSALLEGNARVLCRMQPEGGRKVPVCRVHLTER